MQYLFKQIDQLFAGHEMKSMEYCKHIVQSTIFGGNWFLNKLEWIWIGIFLDVYIPILIYMQWH